MEKLLSPLSILTNGAEFEMLKKAKHDIDYLYHCSNVRGKPAYAPLPFETKKKSFTFDKFNKIFVGSQAFIINLGKHEDGYVYDYTVWLDVAAYLDDRWQPLLNNFNNYGSHYQIMNNNESISVIYDVAEIPLGKPFAMFADNIIKGRVSYRGKVYPLHYEFIHPELIGLSLTEISNKLYSERPKHKLIFTGHNLAIVNRKNLNIESEYIVSSDAQISNDNKQYNMDIVDRPGQSQDVLNEFKGYEAIPIDG